MRHERTLVCMMASASESELLCIALAKYGGESNALSWRVQSYVVADEELISVAECATTNPNPPGVQS
jgi:hypothetical protein